MHFATSESGACRADSQSTVLLVSVQLLASYPFRYASSRKSFQLDALTGCSEAMNFLSVLSVHTGCPDLPSTKFIRSLSQVVMFLSFIVSMKFSISLLYS